MLRNVKGPSRNSEVLLLVSPECFFEGHVLLRISSLMRIGASTCVPFDRKDRLNSLVCESKLNPNMMSANQVAFSASILDVSMFISMRV